MAKEDSTEQSHVSVLLNQSTNHTGTSTQLKWIQDDKDGKKTVLQVLGSIVACEESQSKMLPLLGCSAPGAVQRKKPLKTHRSWRLTEAAGSRACHRVNVCCYRAAGDPGGGNLHRRMKYT